MPLNSDWKLTTTTAFKLTSRISHKGMGISAVTELYRLGTLRQAIVDYYSNNPDELGTLSFSTLDVWHHVQVQLRAARDSEALLPLQRVEAIPPNDEMKYGRCNFVLISNYADMEYNGVCGTFTLPLIICFNTLK